MKAIFHKINCVIYSRCKAVKLPAGYKRNKFCRKIVIFQIHLEDIIENAHVILGMLDQYNGHQLLEDKTKIHELSELVESQCTSINGILNQFNDQSMMNVLKTFTPDTRRKLEILLYDKGAVLEDLKRMLRILSYAYDRKSIPEDYFPNINFIGWNHADFIEKGRSFVSTLHVDSQHSIIEFCQRLNKQDQVLKELEKCSSELSTFISQHINLNEVLTWQNKTNKS